METVRIRLVFEEPHVLSKSQRKNGLKRSWILLKPHLLTLSDFSSYVVDFFLLHHAFPYGLILSMDGFILPPFESTSILKDKDIVRVKKKKEQNVTAVDTIEHSDCKYELEEDEAYDSHRLEESLRGKTRKRRALQTLGSSKRKKNRCAATTCLLARLEQQRTHREDNQSFQKDVISSDKSLVKKQKSSEDLNDTNNSIKQNISTETLQSKRKTIKKKKGRRGKKKLSSRTTKKEGREVDFNKLRPCASLPKRGDIIAYRLIELSSSWTPGLSSFRVGKVSWYKPEANKIVLIPVREYPFVFKKVVNGESANQVRASPYGEDGLLKADYSSLIDIRIVKSRNSNRSKAGADSISKVSFTKQSWNKWKNSPGAEENRNEKGWDEILKAMTAKKTESSKQIGWSGAQKEVQGRSPWSMS